MDDSKPFFNKKISELTGDENFQSWKQQVLITVCGFQLGQHFFSFVVVSEFILYLTGAEVLNSAYVK